MTGEKLLEMQLLVWSSYVYDIIRAIDRDDIFLEWFLHSKKRVNTNVENEGRYFNLSDVSFSMLIKKENPEFINGSRFYIGFFEPTEEDRKLYKELASKWVEDLGIEDVIINNAIGLGMGFDEIEKEKRLYVAFLDKNNNPKLIGNTYKENKLIESKLYHVKNEKEVIAESNKGQSRYQKNIEDIDEFYSVLESLKLPEETKDRIREYAENISSYLTPDTYSLSESRIAFYFD